MHSLETGPISFKKIIIFHHGSSLGYHFLDWSFYWLSGADEYPAHGSFSQLVNNPLQGKTAHSHSIRIFREYNDMISYFNSLKDYQGLQVVHFTGSVVGVPKIVESFNQTFNQLAHQDCLVICPVVSPQHRLVPLCSSRSYRCRFDGTVEITQEQKIKEIIKDWFGTTNDKWQDQHIWDLREQLALAIDESVIRRQDLAIPARASNIVLCDSNEIFFQLPDLLIKIFKLSNIKINDNRWKQWISLYNVWQQLHDVKFSEDCDMIVKNIVEGQSMSLLPYNLNLFKEAIIQKRLVEQYNLNLKTWQLEKFPDNTIELFRLLETNQHIL